MNDDEQAIADRANTIAEALQDEVFAHDVFYEDDGDEGWYVAIHAGHQHYLRSGGSAAEFTLAFWTRDNTWHWDRVEASGKRSGPWPCRDLDAAAQAAEVVEYVRRNVICGDVDPYHLAEV